MSDPAKPPFEGRGEGDARRVWWVVAAILVVVVALRFGPKFENPLAPEPRAAHVAIQLDGEEVASDGLREIEAGRSFRLYAVLEAETLTRGTIYFSEARALRLGGVEIPADAIRPWPGGRPARVRWQTVEPFAPYLAVAAGTDLDRFHLAESYHPEWGTGWTAGGIVDPRIVQLDRGSELRPLPFGTQRFEARIELYENEDALTPAERWSSPGPEAMLSAPERASGVIARLPEPLAQVSGAFGRLRLDPADELAAAEEERVVRLVDAGFAYLAPGLLAAHLEESGLDPGELAFETVELGPSGPTWGAEVETGDLLGAGDRMLILWRDEGIRGRLDPDDLAFDLHRGLRIDRVGQVFLGDESLRLDHARLTRRTGPGSQP